MRRRESLFACAAALTAPMLNLGRCRMDGRTWSVRTVDLVHSSLVIDMLGLLTSDWPRLKRWQEDPSTFDVEGLEAVRATGIHMLHPAVDLQSSDPWGETTEWLAGWNRLLAAHPTRLARVDRCADLDALPGSSRVGVLLGIQNSDHFRFVSDVAQFRAAGQRLSQLTYNGSNRLGHGCMARVDRGLSEFGAEVVRAMNAEGMIVDVSHAGERTMLDAFEASGRPVLITHANCRALNSHPRCKSDAAIRAMAAKGGVMGVTAVPAFLGSDNRDPVEKTVNHMAHVAQVAGVEHVGIGSDGEVGAAPHLVYAIAEELLRRRWIPSDIRLILGGNFRRSLSDILC